MHDGYEHMTWEDLGAASRILAERIHADEHRPDLVLAVARGGLLLAGALSYALGIKRTRVVNVEFYTGIGERLVEPVLLPPMLELSDLAQARVLVADDVADTGSTLALVRRLCEDNVGEVRTTVLYEKPSSVVSCDYVWRRTDRWVVFPWSADPPVGEETLTAAREA